ncbi:MAG: hypothetical protein Sylvanvirus7_34 [Sylvanvirus sp.]|uniref:Uncharacterized protein n=1 Tax=Sylvanvirus sp. TaxID=2487774 RepID=A0A3G5AHU4_9VIRU|nr:MAG: hypothetical protein Sylvanvirus7_34 [Sylvanvirus sp.]
MGKGSIKGDLFKVLQKLDIQNKELVLRMLRREDEIMHSKTGQDIYRLCYNNAMENVMPQIIIQRMVLNEFGFTTSNDQSLNMYHQIMKEYYQSPTEYDEDVMQAVTYFRENSCLYFTSPCIELNQPVPDCYDLYELSEFPMSNDTKELDELKMDSNPLPPVDLHSILSQRTKKIQYTMLCGFSGS